MIEINPKNLSFSVVLKNYKDQLKSIQLEIKKYGFNMHNSKKLEFIDKHYFFTLTTDSEKKLLDTYKRKRKIPKKKELTTNQRKDFEYIIFLYIQLKLVNDLVNLLNNNNYLAVIALERHQVHITQYEKREDKINSLKINNITQKRKWIHKGGTNKRDKTSPQTKLVIYFYKEWLSSNRKSRPVRYIEKKLENKGEIKNALSGLTLHYKVELKDCKIILTDRSSEIEKKPYILKSSNIRSTIDNFKRKLVKIEPVLTMLNSMIEVPRRDNKTSLSLNKIIKEKLRDPKYLSQLFKKHEFKGLRLSTSMHSPFDIVFIDTTDNFKKIKYKFYSYEKLSEEYKILNQIKKLKR